MTSISKEQRDELVNKIYEQYKLVFRKYDPEAPKIDPHQKSLYKEQFYFTLGEYADRLPRIPMSVCPYCKTPLKRIFDPFGLDGQWWHKDSLVEYNEPDSCEHFKVILGALSLNGREPFESVKHSIPGPGAPFVVPALLDLSGMVAVIGSIKMETGDIAYPISYFSDQEIKPINLHQFWLEEFMWFKDEDGNSRWSAKNDKYDFDLLPYVEKGNLKWVDLEKPEEDMVLYEKENCPFIDLPGDRERQQVGFGRRSLLGLPTGEALNPYE